MRKLHSVTHLASNNVTQDKLFALYDLISVSTFNVDGFDKDVCLLAHAYSGDRSISLSDNHSHELPFTNMYIEINSEYFQVGSVVSCHKLSNQIMSERNDIAIIATIDETNEHPELHFLASVLPSKIKCI